MAISQRSIEFATPGGARGEAYLAAPDTGGAPGLTAAVRGVSATRQRGQAMSMRR